MFRSDMRKRHELKTWPEFFQAVVDGRKTAELRRDDRGFTERDLLWLREWDPTERRYTGREASATITHVVRGTEHLAPGFALLSFGRVACWSVTPEAEDLARLRADVERLQSKLLNMVVAGERLAFSQRWLDAAVSWEVSGKLTATQAGFVFALRDAKEGK